MDEASAHTQGLVISALVRAWRLTHEPRVWDLLRGASNIFDQDVEDGGVRVKVGESTFYTEVPGGPVPGILDGFLTSLLGLYDLKVETEEPTVNRLFMAGVDGLRCMLPAWDYQNKWSWYGCREYLCPPAYHCQNRLLLEVLGTLLEEPTFLAYAERWNPTHLTILERARVRAWFVVTKNGARLRHRMWRYKTVPEEPLSAMRMHMPEELRVAGQVEPNSLNGTSDHEQ